MSTAIQRLIHLSGKHQQLIARHGLTCRAALNPSSHGIRWSSSYPAHEVVGMPSLSPTMESGSIVKWNKSENEKFLAGDVLCEVETDKATVDFEAQDDGVIARILMEAGPDDIQCGEPICITVEEEGDVDAFKDYVVIPGIESSGGAEYPTKETAPPEVVSVVVEPTVSPPQVMRGDGERIVASPLAHMLAKEKGIDISSLIGTGPSGRIIAADIDEYVIPTVTAAAPLAAAAQPTAPVPSAPAAPIPGIGYTDYPLSASSLRIAAELTQSKITIPHYYLTVTLSLDNLINLRKTLNSASNQENGISLYSLLLKATAKTMQHVPAMNAAWMDTHIRSFQNVDLNVVVGSGASVRSPVLTNANSAGLSEIDSFLKDNSDDEQIPSDAASLGTFSVVNLGMYGITSASPIIRPPQAGILALGAAQNTIQPCDDGELPYKNSVTMVATLSCDHRVVDGAVGANWLQVYKDLVENPEKLIL